MLKILAVKTRDKTTVKLLNHKLRYRKPEILLAFLLKWTRGRRHQHHDCESNPTNDTNKYRSNRFSPPVKSMIGADGSVSELLAATKCTPRLQ